MPRSCAYRSTKNAWAGCSGSQASVETWAYSCTSPGTSELWRISAKNPSMRSSPSLSKSVMSTSSRLRRISWKSSSFDEK